MGLNTKIEWTRSEDGTLGATWNPLVGCTKVSPGCDHCYAETLVNRFAGKNKAFPNRFDVVTIRDDSHLLLPLSAKWQRQPLRIFVNSLSDLFHDDVPTRFIARVFAVMAHCPQHTFQMLTKRHGRMRALLNDPEFIALYAFELGTLSADRLQRKLTTVDALPDPAVWPLPNVHGGVSAEDQKRAGLRLPPLGDAPFAVRWVSLEPLLGPVTLEPEWLALLDWVVVGGETGAHARPMHPAWARSLRDQCVAAGVPFHFKQWGDFQDGSLAPGQRGTNFVVVYDGRHEPSSGHWDADGGPRSELAHDRLLRRPGTDQAVLMSRVGKAVAGRTLDGRLWDEAPQPVTAAS